MNTKTAMLAIAAAAAVIPLVSAFGADEGPIIAYTATQALPALPLLARGASAESVRRTIGEPPTRLSPDVWVYWDYRTAKRGEIDPAFDTLVITFKDGSVADFRLVDGRDVRAVIDHLEASQADSSGEGRGANRK